jgi:hypothetical protein
MTLPTVKVFGIGWAKTGTTSLGQCLRLLGYRHTTHKFELVPNLRDRNLEPIFAVADRFESFEDWPWIVLFRELDARYPGSRFILTTREEQTWLRSYRQHLGRKTVITEEQNERRGILYGLPFPDVTDEQLIGRYRRHHEEVRAHFANRPGDLLEVDWSAGDGWVQLCGFLGHPVPEIPFPHANRAGAPRSATKKPESVRERLARLLKGALRAQPEA